MSARGSEATRSPDTDTALRGRGSAEARSPSVPYVRYGVPAGVVGAALVALFFLAVDVAAGRPLATPNALGAALFLGEPLDLSRDPRPAIVLGYTAVHGAVFVALGCLGALALATARRRAGTTRRAVTLAAAFFVLCEAVFLGFAGVFGFPVASELGFGRISAANALAAAAMGIGLARFAPSGGVQRTTASRSG